MPNRLTRLFKIHHSLPVVMVLLAALSLVACVSSSSGAKPTQVAEKPHTAEQAEQDAFDETFSAVVGVFAHIPDDARTAGILGTRRQGSGVLIDDDGLILTIGYLIMESNEIVVVGPEGNQIMADFVAYDHPTGFGLLRARKSINAKSLKLGTSKTLDEGQPVLAVSFDGRDPVIAATVVSRRPFAGYWEYLLDSAIFTLPPHHQYGGAALIDSEGKLVGIGSLIVNDAVVEARPVIGNMFVPIDTLKPILEDLIASGRRQAPVPPWLGVYTDEAEGRVYITGIATDGPAQEAGLKPGDIIIGVDGKRVSNMIDFFQKVRRQGDAGSSIRLDVLPIGAKDLTINRINVKSLDRSDWLQMSYSPK